jgi:hypothetical protein
MIVLPAAVPASGQLEIPSTTSPTWPSNIVVCAQFLTIDPVRVEIQASNTFTATSRY